MVNPAKVQNFLDVAGQWDPTLALVFGGALAVAVPIYQWTLRYLESPVVGDEFDVPDNDAITPRLLGGSALFGIGWGLAGFCPGPGLTALATLAPGAVAFVLFMFVGAALYKFVVAR
jgi:uncharacterized membrane protein YedE/YeeE